MSSWQEWSIRDFSEGIIDKVDDDLLPNNAARESENFISNTLGTLITRKGQQRLNVNELDGFIQGLHIYYKDDDAVGKIVVASGGGIYYWDQALKTFNPIKIGLDEDAPVHFANCVNYMVAFNGKDTPIKWDGEYVTDLNNYKQIIREEMAADNTYKIYTAKNKPIREDAEVIVRANGLTIDSDDYSIDYENGKVTFNDARLNQEVEANTIPSQNNKTFEVVHPIKNGSSVTVRDRADDILAGYSINYSEGSITFSASKEDVMPITISYEWADDITIDYQHTSETAGKDWQYPILHKEKLFIVPQEKPSQIWWSNSFQPEEWPEINYWTIKQGDGDYITALVQFLGELVIFKRNSIHSLRGNSLDDFRLDEIDSKVGCVGARATVADGTFIYFVNEEGFYSFNGMKAINVSERRIPKLWKRINKSAIDKAALTVREGLVWIALPIDESTINNAVLIYDHGGIGGIEGKFWLWTGINASCFVISNNDRLYSGDSLEGYINEQDIGDDDFGEDIHSYWIGKAFDQDMPEREKKAKKAFVTDIPFAKNNIELKLSLDYEEFFSLEFKSSDGLVREYRFPDENKKRWRYIIPKFSNAGKEMCEVRGLMIPFKTRRKPRVRED